MSGKVAVQPSGLAGMLDSLLHMPVQRQELLLKFIILALIYILAFSTRLFSVLRYESVIHEFDPYFNFRSTKHLVNEGFYNFYNWFDDTAWYPLGRVVGSTVYPGLMITAAWLYWILQAIHITIDIRNVCVLLAPFFASNTAMVAYCMGKEVRNTGTGLLAAALIAIVPGYISRSVAGSYDNEAVAIFALIWTFHTFVKAVKTGSLFWSALSCLAYFYMVNAWGGYIFIINLIPLYVFALIVIGRYSHRLYVAYSTFYVVGTLLAMQVRFVNFQAIQSSEHMAAMGVFGFIQAFAFVNYIRSLLDAALFKRLFKLLLTSAASILAVSFILASATGYIAPWTGRFYTLLDPTYAKDHIPIIASVSEHQPTTWSSFFFDLHLLVFLFPAGLWFCFRDLDDGIVFIILYGLTSVYFAGVMVRLMLVLAPAACLLAAIGLSELLTNYCSALKNGSAADSLTGSDESSSSSSASSSSSSSSSSAKASKKAAASSTGVPWEIALVMLFGLTCLLVFYTVHCTWVTSEAYSSPSIVLAARGQGGSRIIFDDFREAYYWLRMNTREDAKVMSWWDYGYQLSAMANRTIIVDNNTWNNTHIATVGKAMSGDEDTAYEIMKKLDVDYVLVIFGGLTGYASDDINKFLWMVRIGGSVDPTIKEQDYFSPRGEYRIDREGSPRMLNTLMYKMCYYRFGEVYTEYGKPAGWDRVRNAEIGVKDFQLEHIEEAYTTEHWLVRIYAVKKDANRG